MKNFLVLVCFFATCSAAYSFDLFKKDYRKENSDYVYGVQKQDEKDRYKKEKMDIEPSGFMTVEEYEMLSAPKDKTQIETEIPKLQTPSDMKYIPQPSYKIVRYNNPPGSPELSLRVDFHKNRQQNGQGITSPDYSIMVYPAIYYYPGSAGVATDLFVIPLNQSGTPLSKIQKANVMHRNPEPILSTDMSVKDKYVFRTLTPVDFSYDSTKLLVKEKVGSSLDGIWETNAIVYDFETKTSYKLFELRDAIVYYWKVYKGLDLDERRWDIYPLGFDLMSPYRVVAAAYAFTGDKPVFLGIWSIDSKGSQSRLVSLTDRDARVSMNGYKIIKDGSITPVILEAEERQLKAAEKALKEKQKAEKDAEIKKIKEQHKANMKELKEQHSDENKEFKYRNKIQGSTTQNDIIELYNDEKILRDMKEEQKLDQKRLKELEKEERQLQKEIDNSGNTESITDSGNSGRTSNTTN